MAQNDLKQRSLAPDLLARQHSLMPILQPLPAYRVFAEFAGFDVGVGAVRHVVRGAIMLECVKGPLGRAVLASAHLHLSMARNCAA